MNPKQIKRARRRMGWTQERMADLFGVSRLTVIRWENGSAKMQGPAKKLLKLFLTADRIIM